MSVTPVFVFSVAEIYRYGIDVSRCDSNFKGVLRVHVFLSSGNVIFGEKIICGLSILHRKFIHDGDSGQACSSIIFFMKKRIKLQTNLNWKYYDLFTCPMIPVPVPFAALPNVMRLFLSYR
jgi:hypothetical protein